MSLTPSFSVPETLQDINPFKLCDLSETVTALHLFLYVISFETSDEQMKVYCHDWLLKLQKTDSASSNQG